jgi:hypothetical protein
MRCNIITAIIFLLPICSQIAQGKQVKPPSKSRGQNTSDIKVYPARGKQIRIIAGTKRTLVNLTDDISGCLDLYDPTVSRRPAKRALGVKVIDRVSKEDKLYLVFLAEAQSNCNVQGNCGAASNYTLIWLKLDADFKLEAKNAAVIEDCRSDISVISPADDAKEEPAIKQVRGKITLQYGATLDDNTRPTSQLVYDRKSPEQGFVTTIVEKKPK